MLLDAANYRKIVPGADPRRRLAHPGGTCRRSAGRSRCRCSTSTGTLVIHERPDGAEIDLVDGDFSPGKLIFTATPRATGGGSTLLVDAQLDIRNAGWLIRRLVKLSPAGEPAALVAASYVTLRAVALRAENAGSGGARRPAATPAPPPVWSPSPRALADEKLAALRAHGAVALVARTWSQRLGRCRGRDHAGRADAERARAAARSGELARVPGLADDQAARRSERRRRRGRGQPAVRRSRGDVDAPSPVSSPRWTATDGVITGARLGWEIYPIDPRANAGAPTLMALMMYPRLETTGRLARKAIASEPLLEHGLAGRGRVRGRDRDEDGAGSALTAAVGRAAWRAAPVGSGPPRKSETAARHPRPARIRGRHDGHDDC